MGTTNMSEIFVTKPLVNSPDHPWQLKNQNPHWRTPPTRPNREAHGLSYPMSIDVDDFLDDEYRNYSSILIVDGAVETGSCCDDEFRPVEFSLCAVEPYL